MRRRFGSTVSLLSALVLALAFLGIHAQAEVLTATVLMSPANEVPPISGLTASGAFQVTINVTRDGTGAVTAGAIRFLGSVAFPGNVTVQGLHIHEGLATATGPVRFDSGLNGSNTVTFASGAGLIDLNATTVNVDVLKRLLDAPTGFYVNLHTSVNPAGALRAQITRLTETTAATVAISPANEVPALNLNATGTATITINPTRKSTTGDVTGATVSFSVSYDFGGDVTVTGLHIHEGAAGVNGPVVINTGLSGTNNIRLTSGKGSLSIPVPLRTTAELDALKRLLQNPAGFYVNIHTTVNAGGAMRGQLIPLAAPPSIVQASTYFLPTGNTTANLNLLIAGLDLASTVLVNGQPANALPDLTTGIVTVPIQAALLGANSTLMVQVRSGAGLLSTPIYIPVAGSTNSTAVTTTDAARFGQVVSPDSVASAFGTNLATATATAPGFPAPVLLDGSVIYVNGVQAGFYFVSPTQVNFQIPAGTLQGAASVVIVNKNGDVSRGTATVAPTIPGLFTLKSDGTGAPAAVASADGTTFNLPVGAADGSTVGIDAGNYVSLFGTGIRFASAPVTLSVGGTAVTPLYAGPQGTLIGLDQINLQIPASLAGKGDVDVIVTVDGKTSNTVKLKIK